MKSNCFMPQFVIALFCSLMVSCNHSPTESESNTKPTIDIISPVDGATEQEVSLYLEWTSADNDNDDLTFDLYFDSTSHYSTGWPLKARGIRTKYYQISGLKYNKRYYWRVCAKDGRDSVLSATYYFRTKLEPITEETFTGLWQTDGYVNDTLNNHKILLLNSDMSFSFTKKRASDDYQIKTLTGYYSITSSTTMKFDYTSTSYTDAYYSYSFSSTRNTLYLTHISGEDFTDGKVGIDWNFRRQ